MAADTQAADTPEAGLAWEPDPEQAAASNVQRFLERHGLESLEVLHERSVRDPEWFYPAVLAELDVRWLHPYRRVLETTRGAPWPEWFPGGRTNLVLNAVDKHVAAGRGERRALVWEGEDGQHRTWTYRELQGEVNRLAGGLQALGVGRGDRVGLFLPMVPETAAALLACAKLGAVVTPLFSGYAPDAAAARLAACEARVLITADGFLRRGRKVPLKETADEAVAAAPAVEHVVVVRRTGDHPAWRPGRDRWYDQVKAAGRADLPTGALEADTPFLLMYTSGTTGAPKATVHTHTGFPLKAALDMFFCFDVRGTDTVFWLTDLGWMMGPWLILGAATLGATVLLYEGAPDHPGPGRLWEMAARLRPTVFGIAPTAVRALMARGDEEPRRHDLSSLRILGSTGEPWNPAAWQWYLEKVGAGRCPIINYSGGTEIAGGILGCYPTRPLKPCAFHGPVPGMAADVVDEGGRPVRGQVGELVLRQPWLGMTRGFWQDERRYLETYWSRWPGLWVHGDWAEVDDEGYWFIHGRSDDTLKIAGKRVGPAEIESALAAHPAVAEAAVIGVPHPVKGEVAVAFVVVRPGRQADPALKEALLAHAGARLGKALAPADLHFVPDLPKTRNAKIVRRLIRGAYLGSRDLGNVTALENPGAVEAISRLARGRAPLS